MKIEGSYTFKTSRDQASNMDLALVSVIIPTYDRWAMVREAIESVLAQTYKGFELIVIDDGSEDETIEQLVKYGTSIRLFSQPRRGVAAARNFGVRQSTGKYVAFLDSDDLWKPKKLEVQVAFMESHPDAEICQTEEVWIRNGVRVNPKKKHRKPSGDIFRASLELCLVSPSAVMMTRKLFDRGGGFDESFPVCEDYDLWLRIAAETRVFLLPEPLVVKRGGHADQLSRSTWGLDRFRVVALRKLLDAGIQGEKRAKVLEALERKVTILAQGAGKRGKQSEASDYTRLVAEFIGEINDASSKDSCLRQGQRIS